MIKSESEQLERPEGASELEKNPRCLAITTTTFCPKWYRGQPQNKDGADKLRDDLALSTLGTAKNKGYQIVVVDGNSSVDFKKTLNEQGITFIPEKKQGMSASRQQAFREAAAYPGVNVLLWTEPEKQSLLNGC